MHTRGPQFRTHVVTVAVATLVGVAFLLLLLRAGGQLGSGEGYRFQAVVPSSDDVYAGATVRLAGLRVGTVKGVRRQGSAAVLTLALEDQYAPMRRDTRVEVRLRTVAGENYVELYPGTPEAPELPEGGRLPMAQAVQNVTIDQVLSVMDDRTRRRSQAMFQGLDAGIGGRGMQVNDLAEQLNGTVRDALPVTRVLDRDREQLARIVDGLGTVTDTIGRRGAQVRLLARQGRAAAEAVAARDDALRATLDELPPTLQQVRSTTTLLRDTTGVAAPVLADTAGALRDLEPSIDLLQPATDTARTAVRELGEAAPPLTALVRNLRRITDPAIEALAPVRRTFCQANPLLDYLRPYAPEFGVHLANLASGTNFYTSTAHAARVHAVISTSAPVIFTPQTSAAVDQLLSSGLLGQLTELGWNPYPKPGGVADTETGKNATGPSDSDLPFRRLRAAC